MLERPVKEKKIIYYSKKHLTRYRLFRTVLMIPYLFVSLMPLFLGKPLWTVLIGVLLYIPLNLLFRRFAYKNLLDILIREHNSQKFYHTFYRRPIRPFLPLRLHAQWYEGHYEKLIELSEKAYQSSKNLQTKCSCLIFLARAYFELHHMDQLKEVTDRFFELKKAHPDREKWFSDYQIFHFYQSFLDADYKACMAYLDEKINSLDMSRPENHLTWLTQQANRAVCAYWQGDRQSAEKQFTYFKENTPELANFNSLADRYLSAIHSRKPSALCVPASDPDDQMDLDNRFLTVRKSNRQIGLIAAGVILLISFPLIKSKIENFPFTNRLNQTVDRNYDQAECIRYFNVSDIDTLCIIEHDGELDLSSLVKGRDEQTWDLIKLIENMQISHEYTIPSVVSENQITLYISDEEISTENGTQVVKFSVGNQSYWIEIRSITPLAP